MLLEHRENGYFLLFRNTSGSLIHTKNVLQNYEVTFMTSSRINLDMIEIELIFVRERIIEFQAHVVQFPRGIGPGISRES